MMQNFWIDLPCCDANPQGFHRFQNRMCRLNSLRKTIGYSGQARLNEKNVCVCGPYPELL